MVADLELGRLQRAGPGEGEGTMGPLQPILPQPRVQTAMNRRVPEEQGGPAGASSH